MTKLLYRPLAERFLIKLLLNKLCMTRNMSPVYMTRQHNTSSDQTRLQCHHHSVLPMRILIRLYSHDSYGLFIQTIIMVPYRSINETKKHSLRLYLKHDLHRHTHTHTLNHKHNFFFHSMRQLLAMNHDHANMCISNQLLSLNVKCTLKTIHLLSVRTFLR